MTHVPEIGSAAARPMLEERGERGSHKWYLLGILVMIKLLGTVGRGVISVIAEPLKAEFHFSDKQLGLLSGMAYSATFALAVLPMGWVADRVSRRTLLSTTVAIWSLLTAACALSSRFATMFLARMGAGAGEAPVVPTSLSLIADTYPAKLRYTAVSLFLAGGGIGVLLLFFLGAWLIEQFGWRFVFLVSGGPGLLLVLLFFSRPERSGARDIRCRGKGQGGFHRGFHTSGPPVQRSHVADRYLLLRHDPHRKFLFSNCPALRRQNHYPEQTWQTIK